MEEAFQVLEICKEYTVSGWMIILDFFLRWQ